MKKNNAFRRAAALLAALSITVSLAAPAFAETYYIDDGDITITKNEDGKQTVQQGSNEAVNIGDDEEIIITTRDQTPATQESDLEGPAAEDSGFGPVVEDNYQPAQPESAEEPKDADQPENTDRSENTDQPESADQPEDTDQQEDADQPESAEQQAQPQQAAPAPAAAPARNIITVINNFANTVLNLTLKDVKIDVSRTGSPVNDDDKGRAALSVQGKGDVEIELDGDNELKSGALRAGLEKTSTGTLTLKDDNQKAGSLTATGNYNGAGIGGDRTGGETVDGEEIQADISGVTTGYIHHIIYEQDGTTIKREWWEPERPQPNPEDPNAPTEESNEVDLGTPGLHVETLEGDLLPFDAQQQGGTLRVTTDNLAARLHGTRQALEALREQGVEQIQFVTSFKTTTLPVEDLLAEGGSWFALEHDGLVSRRLSAAQAESLKCWMH